MFGLMLEALIMKWLALNMHNAFPLLALPLDLHCIFASDSWPIDYSESVCAAHQGSLIALLLLILLFAMVLYARRHWCKRRHVPQKRGSTEATHEIHYIPSVLLGPQGRDGFHNSRLQPPEPIVSMPIRETPILDDYACEEDEHLGQHIDRLHNQLCSQAADYKGEEIYSTKVTHTMERMYKREDSHKLGPDQRGEFHLNSG